MWQFIISGYVPGTDLQVTFDIIATFAAAFFGAILLISIIRHRLMVRKEINAIIARFEQVQEIAL